MAICNGRETLEITDQDAWSIIERDMTIFMNIVLLRSSRKDWRECPACRTRNYPRDSSRKIVINWHVMMLLMSTYLLMINSWSCDRRLQSEDNINASTDNTQIVGVYQENLGLELIRNIRIYKHVGSLTYHNKIVVFRLIFF